MIANLNHIDFGLIQPTGKQTYSITIPEGKNISDFDTVFFYCLQYDHFWDLGKFEKFTASNCTVLSTENFKVDRISFYPNPAQNKISFSLVDGISAEIRIFNVLGKQVFHQPKMTQNSVDISAFNKGIYLVKIIADGKSKTQRLVIK